VKSALVFDARQFRQYPETPILSRDADNFAGDWSSDLSDACDKGEMICGWFLQLPSQQTTG
jgi:hypothetical protein